MQTSTKPVVAIIGRPNVGKSTLFNRLSGRQSAIVSDIAGTTRDRVTTEAVWGDRPFILVDTGGLDLGETGGLGDEIRAQIDVAMDGADVLVLLTDSEEGTTPADLDAANLLRIGGKPVVVGANKAENERRQLLAQEFYTLGLGEPVPISAYHNQGIDDLMARVIALLPPEQPADEAEADIRLAIVGRTNVGKSTLVNTLTGQERAIVSDIPGTTRDALDTLVEIDGKSVLLIDTAGIRRRGRVERGIERYSVLRAIRAIDRAEVVVLVLDAEELATSQDTHVANHVLNAYRGLVFAVNKWDRAREAELTKPDATDLVRLRFGFAPYVPLCFVSALNGSGIEEMMGHVQVVHDEWQKGVPRYELRRVVMEAVAQHPPPAARGRSLKVFSVSMDETAPPTFTFYVNRPDMLHFSYRRYLENALRQAYGFEGNRLRIRVKGRGES